MTCSGHHQACGSWQLVWCHGRCCKEDTEELRDAIADVAQEAGGSLVCRKKAHKFAFWVANGPPGEKNSAPYVLLSDWREIKPCMQVIAQCAARDFPLVIAVLSDQPTQHERIVAWAEQVAAEGFARVHVIEDVSELRGLLQQARPGARSDSGSATPSTTAAATPTAGSASSSSGGGGGSGSATPPSPATPTASPASARPRRRRQGATQGRGLQGAQAAAAAPPAAPWQAGGGHFAASRAPALHSAVGQLLLRLCPEGSEAEVAQLLAAAVPPRYED